MPKQNSRKIYFENALRKNYFNGEIIKPLIGYAIFGMAIVLFSSDAALSDFPLNARFCNWLGQYIPAIAAVATHTKFPELCIFYFSVMFFLMPCFAFFCLYVQFISPFFCGLPLKTGKLPFLKSIYLLLAVPFLTFVLYLITQDTNFEKTNLGYRGQFVALYLLIMLSSKFTFLFLANFLMPVLAMFFYAQFMIPISMAIEFHKYLKKVLKPESESESK